jgi:hypothetical protein
METTIGGHRLSPSESNITAIASVGSFSPIIAADERSSMGSTALKAREDRTTACKMHAADDKGCLRANVQTTPPAKLNHFQCAVTPSPRPVPTPQGQCRITLGERTQMTHLAINVGKVVRVAADAPDIMQDASTSTAPSETPKSCASRSRCSSRSDWSECSSPRSPATPGEPLHIKSDYHKEFADAKVPKKYFEALEKLSERGRYLPRQNYARRQFRKWQRNPSVVVENIWDDSSPVHGSIEKAEELTTKSFCMPPAA